MKIKDYSDAYLIAEFENTCFRHCNYPNNKSIAERLARLETELAKRLNCSVEEVREYAG